MGGACVRPSTPEKVHTVHSLRTFKFRELLDATEHFSDDRVLGEGGFGTVYSGFILENTHIRSPKSSDEKKRLPVAVKRLRRGSAQGIEQWVMEVRLLEKLQHPNLVRLLGYCAEGEQALLVYEYLRGGSLDALLFGPRGETNPLSWIQRIQIACNAAEGLCFLHENNIIHRDMKASNILLDEDFQAKLTDFGLARSGPIGGDTHLSTRVVGTLGYCCPTYMQTGRITIKTDLYAFGVVLLELLTGRPNLGENGEDILADCVRPLLQAPKLDLEHLVDPRLGQEYSQKGANELALLAAKCIEPQPRSRPETDQVLGILKRILKLGLS